MRMWMVCAALAIVCGPVIAAEEDNSQAEQEIRQRTKELEAAWEKHDAKSVAELFTKDGDVITAKGEKLEGREGIEQSLADGFSGDLKDTTLSEDVQKVRVIKPDVALVDADGELKGTDNPRRFHVFSVMLKQDGKWVWETTRVIVYRDE